jgi:hypothetical protein
VATEIKEKFDSEAAFTLSLGGLASSTSGVGQQSTVVDNTTTRYSKLLIFAKIRVGTSPSANRTIRLFLIRDDKNGTNYRTDGAGASDAGLTIVNAQPIAVVYVDSSTSDKDYYFDCMVENPGPGFGVAVVHDTGVNLNSTGSNHYVRYIGVNPEVQ